MSKRDFDVAYGTLKKHGVHILRSDIRHVNVYDGMYDHEHIPHWKNYEVILNTGDVYEFVVQTANDVGEFDIRYKQFKEKLFECTSRRITIDITTNDIKKLEEITGYKILDSDDVRADLSLAINCLIMLMEVPNE